MRPWPLRAAVGVFGVRVAIEVVRGGYARANYDGVDSRAYVQVAPSPVAELTFTF